MTKIGFFCMNKKGYRSLRGFIDKYSRELVSYVVSSRDTGIKNDYFSNIQKLCKKNNILFFNKKEYSKNSLKEDYKIAIGWKWIIDDFDNLIVLHDSLLPNYRGFAPLVNMLINDEKK